MSLKERVDRYTKYNISRKVKSIKFNEDKATFLFKIVPFLLHSNYHDLPGYVDDEQCRFGIHRFSPQKIISRELFVRMFPGSTALRKDTPSAFTNNPCIHSLKTIGSIGTIAETEKSDCDYWVSIRNMEMGETGLTLLGQKCKLIEEWADEQGQEIYFFLMDIDQTRDNSFESKTEDESAGSAIKLLLKDELFRTHVLVAGKMLLWWLIPPGFSEEEYQRYVKKLGETGRLDLNNFIDLGYISNIPKSEIFGACLWQMNKALDSPFKSIIKFAYLELLLRGQQQNINLFSDRIKLMVSYPERLTTDEDKSMTAVDVDPYLLLAREIVSFYQNEQTSKKRDEFIKACLFLKTLEGMESQKKESVKISQMANTSELMQRWNLLPKNTEFYMNFRRWNFKDLLDVGAKVHEYIIDTYKRLRWIFKTFEKEGITITEHDLSVLGRKLFTFYEKKPGKVEYINSISREAMAQADITLHISRVDNVNYFFAYQGEYDKLSVKEQGDYLIRRETHLLRLLVFLMINGIMGSQTKLYMTKNYLDVELVDIQSLVAQLFESFPEVNFSHISAEQLLKNEVIVKALAVINFSKAPVRGSKNLQTAIISANSYGEYFIQDYETLTQYKNALRTLLTQHFVSRWNNNLEIYTPPQSESHLLQQMISA